MTMPSAPPTIERVRSRSVVGDSYVVTTLFAIEDLLSSGRTARRPTASCYPRGSSRNATGPWASAQLWLCHEAATLAYTLRGYSPCTPAGEHGSWLLSR